jgi:hypothetical protein
MLQILDFFTSNVDLFGVYSAVTGANTGTGSINYGIYAKASGGTTNYSAYLDGNVYIGTDTPTFGGYVENAAPPYLVQPHLSDLVGDYAYVLSYNSALTIIDVQM